MFARPLLSLDEAVAVVWSEAALRACHTENLLNVEYLYRCQKSSCSYVLSTNEWSYCFLLMLPERKH